VSVDLDERFGLVSARSVHDEHRTAVRDVPVRGGGRLLPGVEERPTVTHGVNGCVERGLAAGWYVHPRRGMEDDAWFAAR